MLAPARDIQFWSAAREVIYFRLAAAGSPFMAMADAIRNAAFVRSRQLLQFLTQRTPRRSGGSFSP